LIAGGLIERRDTRYPLLDGPSFVLYTRRLMGVERWRSMDSKREIRCYASIPKIILMLVLFGDLTFAIWWALQGNFKSVVLWTALAFFGFITLFPLVWLVAVMVFRQPILRINDEGIFYSVPIMPWNHIVVRWGDVTRIWVAEKRFLAGLYYVTHCYLAVDVNDPDRLVPSRRTCRFTAVYPGLDKAAIVVAFSHLHFIASTRKQRGRLLERIETMFSPGIH
jgi:hypothetical protein